MKACEENHLTWFDGYVTRENREKLHGRRGVVIWFTGLSASGKSTIARIVENKLFEMGCSTYVFDGDNVRHGLCSDLSFSQEDRVENIRRIGEMVNLYAPEHLIIVSKNYAELAELVVNAGSVFLGDYTPESAGDYASGTNHTLPTNGWAASFSGVNMDSFYKKITYQEISKYGLYNIGRTVMTMAEAEQLQAHSNAVSIRLNFTGNE